jgi:hypothetical protein
MKQYRFTDEQIIGFLKQADTGLSVKELCWPVALANQPSTSGVPVIVPFCKGVRSRNVMQPWPVSASV